MRQPIQSLARAGVFRILVCSALGVLLTACGGSSDPKSSDSAGQAQDDTGSVAAADVADGKLRSLRNYTSTSRRKGKVVTLPPPPPTTTVVESPAPVVSDFHPATYAELAFADEFDGSTLDRTKWCTRYLYWGGPKPQVLDAECQRFGAGTLDHLVDEKSRYVDTNTAGETMHVVSSGVLTLRTTKTRTDPAAPYESSMIRSKQLFRPDAHTSYYVTARVKLPNVRGTWPAFWLNSDFNDDGTVAWPPEIDVFEGALNENWDTADMLSAKVQAQNWGGDGTNGQATLTYAAPEFDTNRLTYKAATSLREIWIEVAAEWRDNETCFFVDGYKTHCQLYEWKSNTGTLAAPAHILMNLGIGGSWAGAFGIDDAKMPTKMLADHVRVYRRSF